IGEILADLGAHVLIDLQDLQLDLGRLAFGLSDRGDQLSTLARQALLLTLEAGDPGVGNQVPLPQVIDPDQLLGDPFDLLVLGDDLSLVAADLLAQLQRTLAQLRLLALARGATHLELPPLAPDRLGNVGLVLPPQPPAAQRPRPPTPP